MKKFCFVLVCITISRFGIAQEKIDTDRPDQTESAFTVPKRYFQAELGFNKEDFSNKNFRILHPTSLFRYGINDNLELRLELVYGTDYLHMIPNTIIEGFLEPIEIGTKVNLWSESGLRPQTSIIAHVGLPFLASKKYQTDPVNYSARLTMQNSLSEHASLGYNIGVEGGGGEETAFLYTIAPGWELGDRWYVYGEFFGYVKKISEHYFDFGVAFYPSQNTKVDFSSGFTINNADMQRYLAIGFSFRIK